MNTIYIATGNTKKLQVISETLKDLDLNIESVSLDLNEHQTIDMKKISKEKANQAFEQINAPVIVDDSGVYFEKYNNFPGVYAKPVYEGLGFEGLKLLIEEGDKAYFQTIISYKDELLEEPITFIGKWYGKLSKNNKTLPQNEEMPYNYLFIPDSHNVFVSNILKAKGVSTSQRVIAVNKFKEWYKKNRK